MSTVSVSDEALLAEAGEARKNAYAPYSGYPVGAALLARSGRIYRGANVENAALGLTICAEQVALVKALTEGEREFLKIAIVCGDGDRGFCRPCGACRQALFEFAPKMKVIMGSADAREYEVKPLEELLPDAFTSSRVRRSSPG